LKCIIPLVALAMVIDVSAQSPNSLTSNRQSSDSALMWSDPAFAELDSILNSADSSSITALIDSLLLLTEGHSQLSLRLGYNSNITAATNTVDIKKFGISPGVAYYHKSGAYSDLSAYWSGEYDPALYLTVASLGYLAIPTANWSILGEYSHYFYNKPDTAEATGTATNTPYTNNIYLSNFFDVGILTLRLDYSFLFGSETANRFYPAVGLNLVKSKWLGLERVRFFPSVGLLYGNEKVTTLEPNWTRPLEYFLLIRQGKPVYREVTTKPWGIMNYAVTVPVSISLKNWTFIATYVYNFPQPLPGEQLDVSHGGYISLSVNRYFKL
jgi:hypothetical protein